MLCAPVLFLHTFTGMILLQNSVDFQMDTWTAGFEISLQQLLSVLPGRRKEGTQYPLANDTKSADYDCS